MINIYYTPELKTDHIVIEKKQIHCACCDTPLVDLIITEPKTEKNTKGHTYIFKCPKCNNSSFKTYIRAYANIAGHGNLVIHDVSTIGDTTTVTLK